jgi:hypothetical protein
MVFVMDSTQSIYFFTLHKCASTLFAKHVLKNLDGLQGVDYAAQLFKSTGPKRFEFRSSGHAYGPLRVSLSEDAVVYRQLVEGCLQPEFLADKKAICHVRDPRDILISHYHSAGWTHTISSDPEIAKEQLTARRAVQVLSVDEYAIQQAPALRSYFERLSGVLAHAQHAVLLRYEDMIARSPAFAQDIQSAMPISDQVLTELFRLSEPLRIEDKTAHKRSGKAEQFKERFTSRTRQVLAEVLGDCLERFGYFDLHGR